MKTIRCYLAVALILLFSAVSARAQERGANRNDFSFAVTLGYNASVMQNAQPGNQSSYSVSPLSTNWNDKSIGVGVEFGWFMVDLWRMNFGGGFNYTEIPGYSPIPGTIDETSEVGDGSIPDYEGVAAQQVLQYNASLGFDRYFRTGVDGFLPYAGIKAGFAYGFNVASMDDETWIGKSVAEAYNIRGALTIGADYWFSEKFFIGGSIDLFAYTYNFTVIKPQEGLGGLAADSHNYSALASPTIKVGFVF